MKKIITLFVLTTLIASCNTPSKKADNQTESSPSVDFVAKTYNDSTDKGAAIAITIPFANGESEAIAAINKELFKTVKTVINEASEESNYEGLMQSFIKDYEAFKSEFPDSAIGWEAIVESSVELNTPELICIEIDTYIFTGGAHGNTITASKLFDPKTGKSLELKDIVKDIPAFTKIAESNFRKTFEIPTDATITSTGYWFENDTFALPLNIFFTEHDVVLHYNQYEIAPYAEGSKEVRIAREEVKDLLSINF